jgi:hypothetical protein
MGFEVEIDLSRPDKIVIKAIIAEEDSLGELILNIY